MVMDDAHVHILCEVANCSLSMPNGTQPIVSGSDPASRLHISGLSIKDACRGIDVSGIESLSIDSTQIEHIGWDGASDTVDDACKHAAVKSVDVDTVAIANTDVKHSFAGLHISGATAASVESSYVTDCMHDGVTLDSCAGAAVTDTNILRNQATGVSISDCTDTVIHGCAITDNWNSGVWMSASLRTHITSNTIEGNNYRSENGANIAPVKALAPIHAVGLHPHITNGYFIANVTGNTITRLHGGIALSIYAYLQNTYNGSQINFENALRPGTVVCPGGAEYAPGTFEQINTVTCGGTCGTSAAYAYTSNDDCNSAYIPIRIDPVTLTTTPAPTESEDSSLETGLAAGGSVILVGGVAYAYSTT